MLFGFRLEDFGPVGVVGLASGLHVGPHADVIGLFLLKLGYFNRCLPVSLDGLFLDSALEGFARAALDLIAGDPAL